MIKISPLGSSLLHTPFTNDRDINYFYRQGITITDAIDADLIISGTFKKLLSLMIKFGRKKQYLLWTIEPRFCQYFEPKISYYLLPPFHVMNLYTGVFEDNYFFLPQYPTVLKVEKLAEFKSKKIVSLMTYQAGSQWRFVHNGIDLDLCNLRTKIAIEGYHRGCLDIYGRGWHNKINIGQSRGLNWEQEKIAILQKYYFNLCFENTNFPYYCTEKIWHSIYGGCLPIYYGKGNRIYDDFPPHSFLDYCDFNDVGLLLDYIQNMTLDEFEDRMNLCIQTINKAIERKQEKQPYQKLLEKTMLKIKAICNETDT